MRTMMAMDGDYGDCNGKQIADEDDDNCEEEYHEEAERDAGDDAEILELDKNLKEVKALSESERKLGCKMVTKVFFLLSHLAGRY
jgi:hypothetical protein